MATGKELQQAEEQGILDDSGGDAAKALKDAKNRQERLDKNSGGKQIRIPPFNFQHMIVTIRGKEGHPLIVNSWGEGKFGDLEAGQFGEIADELNGNDPAAEALKTQKEKNKRPLRNRQAEFLDSIYWMPDGGHGFPAIAFKKSVLTLAGADYLGFSAKSFKIGARFNGADHMELCRLKLPDDPNNRRDVVRIGPWTDRVAMTRYRAEYEEWETDLLITFTPRFVSVDALISGLIWAGEMVGIGERRPEKEGNTFGLFEIVNARTVDPEEVNPAGSIKARKKAKKAEKKAAAKEGTDAE